MSAAAEVPSDEWRFRERFSSLSALVRLRLVQCPDRLTVAEETFAISRRAAIRNQRRAAQATLSRQRAHQSCSVAVR